MAEVTRGLTDREARLLAEVVEIVRGRGYDLGEAPRRPDGGLRVEMGAVSTAAISAGGSGEVTCTDGDWAALSPARVHDLVVNDFPVELPVGTKVIIAHIGVTWRVLQPIMECPEEPA